MTEIYLFLEKRLSYNFHILTVECMCGKELVILIGTLILLRFPKSIEPIFTPQE
jgi:hypothetical protein